MPAGIGRRSVVLTLGAAALVVVGIATTAFARSHSSAHADAVTSTAKDCGVGWTAPKAGVRQVTFVNKTTTPIDFELEGTDQLTLFQRVEGVGPGTTMTTPITFPAGKFSWACDGLDGSISRSTTFPITGSAGVPSHPFVQTTVNEVTAAVLSFRETTAARLGTLAADTDTLKAVADKSGKNLQPVQKAWLPAYLDYVRVAGMYDTFGDFDEKIDGRADGLAGGVDDPKWSGFLRLQHDLWNGASPGDVESVTDQLDTDVHGLVADFPTELTQVNDVPIRVHEILENGLQRELTADTDEGSHSNLATLRAEVDATRAALAAETSALKLRDPKLLNDANTGLDALAKTLDGYQHPDGSWSALQSLSTEQHEQLDGQVAALVERLSAVPAELELDPAAQNDS